MAVLTYQEMMTMISYHQPNSMREKMYQSWANEPIVWYFPLNDLEWMSEILAFSNLEKDELKEAYHIILEDSVLYPLMSFIQTMTIIKAHPSDWLANQAPQISHPKLSTSILQLMAILSLIPVAKKEYEVRGIDSSHMMFNLNHLKGYINNYRTKHQSLGIELYGWTTYLASLGLIHLGSLHFMHHRYSEPFEFYRHKTDRHVIAFAKEGIKVRKDGQLEGVNGVYDIAFITSSLCENNHLTAYPVHPKGRIQAEPITIDLKVYDCILKPGDVVIDFHIPTKSDYSLFGIHDSLKKATSFFRKHYSNFDYKAFWCTSWLYSPQIFDLIDKPSSNILAIANQGYILPATPDAKSLYTFVFHTDEPDFDHIEPKTSLEKSIIHFVKSGKTINAGCYLFFLSDIDTFGRTPYQSAPQHQNHRITYQEEIL